MTFVKWVFRLGAISNFLVTAHAIIDPVGNWSTVPRVEALLPESWQTPNVEPLNYPSFLIIWSGMAFLWGVMMWEISTDPVRHQAMIKYTYSRSASRPMPSRGERSGTEECRPRSSSSSCTPMCSGSCSTSSRMRRSALSWRYALEGTFAGTEAEPEAGLTPQRAAHERIG
jgi:hypothetical protein